jgi:hypothetical protein
VLQAVDSNTATQLTSNIEDAKKLLSLLGLPPWQRPETAALLPYLQVMQDMYAANADHARMFSSWLPQWAVPRVSLGESAAEACFSTGLRDCGSRRSIYVYCMKEWN